MKGLVCFIVKSRVSICPMSYCFLTDLFKQLFVFSISPCEVQGRALLRYKCKDSLIDRFLTEHRVYIRIKSYGVSICPMHYCFPLDSFKTSPLLWTVIWAYVNRDPYSTKYFNPWVNYDKQEPTNCFGMMKGGDITVNQSEQLNCTHVLWAIIKRTKSTRFLAYPPGVGGRAQNFWIRKQPSKNIKGCPTLRYPGGLSQNDEWILLCSKVGISCDHTYTSKHSFVNKLASLSLGSLSNIKRVTSGRCLFKLD